MAQEWKSQAKMKWEEQEQAREARAWEEWEPTCMAEAQHEFREQARDGLKAYLFELRAEMPFLVENEESERISIVLTQVETLEEQIEDEDLEIDEEESVLDARAREIFEATPAYYEWDEE